MDTIRRIHAPDVSVVTLRSFADQEFSRSSGRIEEPYKSSRGK